MIKICFIAPSEYGKNTAVEILKDSYNVVNIKIAEPLYYLQKIFYNYINVNIKEEQDGELLQYMGGKIRKENPIFLANTFQERLNKIKPFKGIITNDDCRPPDYNLLKKNGFIFIKINGFKRNRIDHTKSNPNSKLEWQEQLPFDYEVNNWGDLEEYKNNINNAINLIMKERGE